MRLRMVFERDDLQRIRVADRPDPMWELVLSLHRARDGLRAEASERLDRLGPLFTLVPRRGTFPDFLTPARPVTDIGEGCEAVACTPRARLLTDLRAVFARRPAPGWVRELADGDRRWRHLVVAALREAHDALVAPRWHEVCRIVAADRAARVRALARDGAGALLASVPGVLGWNGEVLDIAYPGTRTLELAGRGLTLVPSYFCAGRPVTLVDHDLPPVLIYPAGDGGGGNPSPGRRLVPLLGRTRADCLRALTTPLSTSALAARLGTSVGTASKQAAVLRESGLVDSTRDGGAVVHHVTALGEALLSGEVSEPG
ncbi:ArsR/SmtB family transcription factor [Prauserella flavalba]|uniref:DUF5937 domain-containing protein n=1 Tax=Prauserella flavalba TaxID=1477506 RepID=A0A318LNJ3_9PSEU|nr:winged helix-turn-helix domain-containing protein [Prauserella flavalba]PXY28587.1 hypothetical protein BA062_22235 [Prauserella flavalba]